MTAEELVEAFERQAQQLIMTPSDRASYNAAKHALLSALASVPAPSGAEPIKEFAKAILHGDDEHRAWLTEAADAFIAGQPLPPPRGKGTGPAPQAVPAEDVAGLVERLEDRADIEEHGATISADGPVSQLLREAAASLEALMARLGGAK